MIDIEKLKSGDRYNNRRLGVYNPISQMRLLRPKEMQATDLERRGGAIWAGPRACEAPLSVLSASLDHLEEGFPVFQGLHCS